MRCRDVFIIVRHKYLLTLPNLWPSVGLWLLSLLLLRLVPTPTVFPGSNRLSQWDRIFWSTSWYSGSQCSYAETFQLLGIGKDISSFSWSAAGFSALRIYYKIDSFTWV